MIPAPRPELAGLVAYSPEPASGIRLHANESPYPLPARVQDELLSDLSRIEFNRYPDVSALELRHALAGYVDFPADWIWVGSGSNELLLNLFLAYGGAGRRVMIFEPTYSLQRLQATISGTEVVGVSRDENFSVDAGKAVDEIGRLDPEIVILCSPNNPTGNATPFSDVVSIANASRGLVIVDEAYQEFCGETFLGELRDHRKVVVVRTLSKAFGLAGVRVGYAIADPAILEPLIKVRMPYNLSVLAQTAATAVIRHRDEILKTVSVIVAERERIKAGLKKTGSVVYPSAANFVLFKPPDLQAALQALRCGGVMVRNFDPVIPGCLRVTAGTPEQTDAFLACFA